MPEPAVRGLRVTRRGPVGWLVFDRPGVHNAMDAEMMAGLPAVWSYFEADPSIGAIVVTGTGRAFQTGVDVAQVSTDRQALREMSRRTRDADLRLTGVQVGVTKPTVAAVNGICAGGGLHFVADADVVIASSDATFTDPHVSVGMVSAFEPIGLIKKGVPFGDVARMALVGAGERISAERARQIGLVSDVVEPGQLRPVAQRVAERLAEDPPRAAAVRAAARRGLEEVANR